MPYVVDSHVKIKKTSDKWIPWYFVAFFVVLAILDGIFVAIAVSTHTGVVTEHAYKKGLDYNKTVAASERQDILGWHGRININGTLLSFYLEDKNGSVIEHAYVKAYFSRSTQDGYDFSEPLVSQSNGNYSKNIDFPLKGQWDVIIEVQWNQKQYQQSKRIIIR
jgi:nitrogen fixation protein FixH